MNTLYDHDGHCKYLTPAERDAFLKAADDAEVREVRTFCATLAYTGCRISEALALTADRIDLNDGAIVIECKKKRQSGVYRLVPVPPAFLDMLNMVHDVRAAHKRRDRGKSLRLWNWSRTKGWYVVRTVMRAAKRHGFGIKAVSCGVPLNTLQQLFGHAQLSTTSIYADAMGPEKRQLVERMWK
jgi:integrase/recombinase XerD